MKGGQWKQQGREKQNQADVADRTVFAHRHSQGGGRRAILTQLPWLHHLIG